MRNAVKNSIELIRSVELAKQPPHEQPAQLYAEACDAEHNGYCCTLPKGHTTEHCAHGLFGCIHHRWPTSLSTGDKQ